MFKLIEFSPENSPDNVVDFRVNGSPVTVPRGFSVAAALLYLNKRIFRTSAVSGASRGPHCMMGVCFDCLVEINGEKNIRACQIEVAPDMQVILSPESTNRVLENRP